MGVDSFYFWHYQPFCVLCQPNLTHYFYIFASDYFNAMDSLSLFCASNIIIALISLMLAVLVASVAIRYTGGREVLSCRIIHSSLQEAVWHDAERIPPRSGRKGDSGHSK